MSLYPVIDERRVDVALSSPAGAEGCRSPQSVLSEQSVEFSAVIPGERLEGLARDLLDVGLDVLRVVDLLRRRLPGRPWPLRRSLGHLPVAEKDEQPCVD